MLDNHSGSSESELVQRLQSARSAEEPTSAPTELTDEVEEAAEAEPEQEVLEEVSGSEENDATEENEEQDVFTIKAAGEERNVTFNDLVEGYQKGQDYYKKTSKLADERKEFEESRTQELELINAERAKYSELIDKLESMVSEQEKSAEYWEELLDTDPAEYIRQQKDIELKKKLVSEAKSEREQQIEKSRAELIDKNAKMLEGAIGEAWADEKVKLKDLQDMFDYVHNQGITPEESANIFDYRFWLMVRDAKRYQDLQKTGDVVKKQVRSAPKTVKSKQPVRANDQERSDLRKKVQRGGGKNEADLVALLQAKRNR